MKVFVILATLCSAIALTAHHPDVAAKTNGYDFYKIVKQFKDSGQFDPNSKFSLDDVLYKDIIIINEKNGTCKNAYVAWCPNDTVNTLFMISKQCDADQSATSNKRWDFKIRDGRIKMTIENVRATEGRTLNDEGLVITETTADEFTFEAVRNFESFPKINQPE